jgi:hypothetical protein
MIYAGGFGEREALCHQKKVTERVLVTPFHAEQSLVQAKPKNSHSAPSYPSPNKATSSPILWLDHQAFPYPKRRPHSSSHNVSPSTPLT